MSSANLQCADMSGANLWSADLRSADLRSANMSGANLWSADLRSADMRSANMSGANLRSADMSGADLEGVRGIYSVAPEVGAFEGFKKLRNGLIAHLRIPADAVRVSGYVGRKCRASHALVLEIFRPDGEWWTVPSGLGMYDETPYHAGRVVVAADFDPDPRLECAGGIHFFLTLQEALEYA